MIIRISFNNGKISRQAKNQHDNGTDKQDNSQKVIALE